MTDRVLVTGASGFIAKHIVLQLVQKGIRVRGSVRRRSKADEIAAVLERSGCDAALFEPIELDLTRDEGWDRAAFDCRYVIHTASPFPARQPKGKFDLVPVARDGTLRAMRAASLARCERAVVTSSVAAVFYGYDAHHERLFGERDVSRVESNGISPYAVSKTLAEEAAWDAGREWDLPLVTINPALVFGPLLDRTMGTSARLLDWMAKGRLPFLPNVSFGVADVRDVALAHLRALEKPDAAGHRFIVSGGERTLRAMSATARAAYAGFKGMAPLPMPSWLIHAGAHVSPQLSLLAAEVDHVKRLDTTPLRTVLEIEPRAPEIAIRDLVRSIGSADTQKTM